MQSTAKTFHGACLAGGAFCKSGTGLLKPQQPKPKTTSKSK